MLLLSGSLHHLPKINMDNWGKVIFLVFARKQEVKKTFSVFLQKIRERLSKSSLNVYGVCMVQQKRKIHKLFQEQKSWFQLKIKNSLPYENGKCLQSARHALSWNSIKNLSFLLLLNCWTLAEEPQETPKYLPCWMVRLWKKFSFRALGTNFQLFR